MELYIASYKGKFSIELINLFTIVLKAAGVSILTTWPVPGITTSFEVFI
jgi:hypothetical protein